MINTATSVDRKDSAAMRAITEILTDIVSEAFEKCGYDRSLGCVDVYKRQVKTRVL